MSNEGLTRRECLARGAGAVLTAGAAAAGAYLLYDPMGNAGLREPLPAPRRIENYFATIDFPASHPRISIATGAAHDPAVAASPSVAQPEQVSTAVERMVRAAIAGLDPILGMSRFITRGDVVLIKPNVGFDRPPHLGATTDPEVLRWVIRLCREAGARQVIVTDNPIEAPAACFARSGIRRVADAEGAQVALPVADQFERLTINGMSPDSRAGALLEGWPIFHAPLANATKLIGIAPVKDHNLCSASMNLKNWYGLLGGRRNQLHQSIHETISDLALAFSPTLVIADATRVMLHNGPTGGRLSDVRPGGLLGRPTVIAAVDPVACDAWCYERLLGRDPAQLPYLELAYQKIQAQIAAGERRFAERRWQVYEQASQLVCTNV